MEKIQCSDSRIVKSMLLSMLDGTVKSTKNAMLEILKMISAPIFLYEPIVVDVSNEEQFVAQILDCDATMSGLVVNHRKRCARSADFRLDFFDVETMRSVLYRIISQCEDGLNDETSLFSENKINN